MTPHTSGLEIGTKLDDDMVVGEDCQCHLREDEDPVLAGIMAENICADFEVGAGGYCRTCGHERECHQNRYYRVTGFARPPNHPDTRGDDNE